MSTATIPIPANATPPAPGAVVIPVNSVPAAPVPVAIAENTTPPAPVLVPIPVNTTPPAPGLAALAFPGFAGSGGGSGGESGGGSSLLTDLIAYWKLDQSSGVRYDSTSRHLDLTDNNSVGSTSGKIGNAASFDGENYLSTVNLNSLLAGYSFTVAFWARFNFSLQSSSNPGLVTSWDSGGAYNLRVVSGPNTVNLYMGGTGEISAAAPTDSDWHHYAVRFNATTLNYDLWLDGALVATGTNGSISTWNNGLLFGRFDNFLVGDLDETGLWKKVLTPDEITALYNMDNGKTYPFTS